MATHPDFQNRLVNPLKELLSKLSDGAGRVPLFFMFDEVSHLFINGDPCIYVALRRVIWVLADYPVWTFLLSTESAIAHVAPAAGNDPSARINTVQYSRIQPFISFPVDIHVTKALSTDSTAQLTKPLAEYDITMFERSLCAVYRNQTCNTICRFCLQKLLGHATDDPEDCSTWVPNLP